MTNTTEIIRAGSNGTIRIDTRDGSYGLSHTEVRELLLFDRLIILRQGSTVFAGEAMAYTYQGEPGILITLYPRFFYIPRTAFVMVAIGALAATPMTEIPWLV